LFAFGRAVRPARRRGHRRTRRDTVRNAGAAAHTQATSCRTHMVDHNLIQSLGVSDEEVEKHLSAAAGSDNPEDVLGELVDENVAATPGAILKGHVVNVIGDEVIVEVGLKSEGAVHLDEFDDPKAVEPGLEVEVYLEAVESDSGLIELSKTKADRIRGWENILATKKEGDTVTGTVSRKIKGGLLVDISVPAFLPASQVDIRRPGDIAEYIGKEIEAKILKIDEGRRNIVISRRKLIEERRQAAKEKLLAEIEEGELRKGVVKNIADFGAFVDLGGIDGLLHITDMSWGRIGHPSEIVSIEEEIEVMVLRVDKEKEKIALGLKQKTPSPWEKVGEKYPVGTKVTGEAVNIVPYGVFVKLEEGLEGLVHISEMSWTKRINHPSEMVNVGDDVGVVVLDIDKEKNEISLGMKQAEKNPWTLVKEKYPPGTVITGTVRNMTNFGAFVEIEEGIDGLLHVSDLSWTRKIGHPSEVLQKGQEVQCVVLAVDEEKQRVALGLKQLTEDPWLRQIPEHYLPGQIVRGKVTKITNFGVFVELEPELEGLLHVSELAEHKVDNPKDVVNVGDEIEVKILRVDAEERKIGLSLKRAQWAAEDAETGGEGEAGPAARRGGLAAEGGTLADLGDNIISSVREGAQQPEQKPAEANKPEQEKTEEAETPEKPAEPSEQSGESEPAEAKADDAEQTDKGKPEAEQKPGEAEAGEKAEEPEKASDESETEDEGEKKAE
jgi:small subunit ribosomal protein S1